MKPHAKLLATSILILAACGGPAQRVQPPPTPAATPAASASGASTAELLAPDLSARRAPPNLRKTPFIGLTVSGGVSLGAYEAGFLYYLSEVAKLPRTRPPSTSSW